MKSLKNRARSNKLNVWFILLGVGVLFVVFYYFLGKKFGIRESMTPGTGKKGKTTTYDETDGDEHYDYNKISDLQKMAQVDHGRILDLETTVFGANKIPEGNAYTEDTGKNTNGNAKGNAKGKAKAKGKGKGKGKTANK